LHPRHALGWVSRLSDEIILIAYNSRPDMDPRDADLLVSLKNGKEQFTLPNGHMLYLKESDQGKGLHLSEAPTGLCVKPILLDNGAVLVETVRKLTSSDGKILEEKGQFIVSPQGGVPSRYNSTGQRFVQELKSARGFAQDLLVQKYGDREFSAWKEKAALEITRDNGTYALFVSPGDYLLYEEGEWHVVAQSELIKERPAAQIMASTGKSLEIQAWDETGFYPLQIKIEMEKPARYQPKPEVLPSAIRLRSGTQVSCALGKRRIIVRQGDWLLKTATGWRNLRRSDEIENYLHHRLKGELLVFDAIEKEQGRTVMKGHMFDETRTQMHPLMINIDAEKAEGKAARKRKSVFPDNQRRAA